MGTRATSAPQSGLTSWLMKLRIDVQIWSMGGLLEWLLLLAARRAGQQHVEEQRHRHRQEEQQGQAGEVHVPAERNRGEVIDKADNDEGDADQDRDPRVHGPPDDYRMYSVENRRIHTTSTKCQYIDVASTMS